MRRSLQQEQGARDAADATRNHQWRHYPRRYIEPAAIGAAAGGDPSPQRDRVRSISGNRRNTGKQQRRKRDKTSAASDGVYHASQNTGDEQKDGLSKIQ